MQYNMTSRKLIYNKKYTVDEEVNDKQDDKWCDQSQPVTAAAAAAAGILVMLNSRHCLRLTTS